MKLDVRFKDWHFWITIVALFATATGFNFEDFKTWVDFFNALGAVFADPSRVITFLIALYGVVRNSATKGFVD
jgi:uncharacterized membrane protein